MTSLTPAASTRGQRITISKALYRRDSHVSVLRASEFAAGAGLFVAGVGRSKMIGSALGRGVKMASQNDNHRAVEALQRAQAAQGVLRRGTAPSERHLRQIQSVDRAVRAVPASMRPGVAMAAGALLMGNATPVRSTTYRPVPVRW